MTGTVAISWGPNGGVYLHHDFSWRICLWRVALTYVPVELDDMMEAYAERGGWTSQRTPAALPLFPVDHGASGGVGS